MEIYPTIKPVQTTVAQPRPSDATAQDPVKQPPVQELERPQREQPKEPPNRRELEAAAKAINEKLALEQRKVQLKVDDRVNTPVISVIDVESEEVIRQLPAEHVLKLAAFRAENPPFPDNDTAAQLLDEKA